MLKTGSLRVEPALVSKEVIGPTLGAKAIERGAYSLLAGTLLSLLIPCVFVSQRREFVLKRICLLLIPFSLVAPYSVLPNHLTGYYGLTWCTLLCAAAAAGLCSRRESPDAHPVV